MTKTSGAVTKDEVMASDNAEVSGRANVQEPVRDLAESTGGFLIGDSNDLRVPLRHVNEEISSYYEVFFNPGIQNYDGSFRKIAVNANRKDLVIHARNGYFALPPEARAGGMEAFEVPLLKMLSDAKASDDVKFRSGAILLQPGGRGNRGGRSGGSAAARIAAQTRAGQGRARRSLLAGRPGEGRQGRSGSEAGSRPRVSGDCRPTEVGQLPRQDDGRRCPRESTAWKAP